MHLNDCYVNDIKWGGAAIGIGLGFGSSSPCNFIFGILAGIIAANVGWIDYLNSGCKGDGVLMNRQWNGFTNFTAVC